MSMRNSDYASRRHDGSLRAELRKLDIDDNGPRRVEGSPGHVGERSHRGSTASTTASAVPPRLSATLVASTESSRRRAVPPPAVLGWGGSAAERLLAEAARLHTRTALDNAQQRNVVAPPRGLVEQHTQKERRRATRGFGVRLEGRPRGTGILRTGPRQARGLRPRTRKIRPMRLAGDRSRATPRRAHRAGTVGDLGVPAGVLRGDWR